VLIAMYAASICMELSIRFPAQPRR
jgi:hypothetical protein